MIDYSESWHLASVICLLDHGARIDSKGWVGSSALHAASEMGKMDVMKTLIERGLDVSVVNDKLETPLHLASGATGFNSLDCVQLLLQYGAHLSTK